MSGQLVFDIDLHEYSVDGKVVPSVTQVLRPLVNFDGIDPDVLERKRLLGTDVHVACYLHDEDELEPGETHPDVMDYVRAWCRFLLETGALVVRNEHMLFHPVLRFAGTIDRVVQMPDKSHLLLDLKTGDPTPTHALQVAGYRLLLDAAGESAPSMQRGCVHLRPDGSYKLVLYSDPADVRCFMALINIWHWKAAHP